MKRIDPLEMLFAVLASVVLLLVIAPVGGLIFSTTFGELGSAAAEKEVADSLRLTLSAALVSTAVTSIFAIPLAWILARRKFPGRSFVLAVVDLPIIIPHSAAGIALLTVIGRHGILGTVTGSLAGTFAGICAAMSFVAMPFLVNAARLGFEAVPLRLEHAARSLGASAWRTFFTVTMPLASREILSGMILMWARGISEFGAVVIIAYHPMTTPVMVFQRFNDFGLSYARSVAVLLIGICVAIFAVLRFVTGRRAGAGNA